MAKTGTYTQISSYTTTGSQSSVTLSAIPGNYTDIIIVQNFKYSGTRASMTINYNGDVGANYANAYLGSNGATVTFGVYGSSTAADGELVSDAWQPVIFQILDYANTTTYKTGYVRGNSLGSTSSYDVHMYQVVWNQTSAITSVKFTPANGTFTDGSTFIIYGIEAK
jgi:hypothetical protein